MADQTNTAETGTHSNPATAYIVEATKGVFVNDSLTRAVVLNTKLEKASRGVMLALATYANVQHHRAWASVPSLARRAGYSQRTTQQQLRELERLGYIQSIKDEVTRVTTTYQIVTQKLVQELCGTAAGPSSVAPAKTAPGGEKAAPGGEILAPGGVKSSHPKKEGIEEGFESNREKGETRAHATPLASRTTEPTFPALPPSIFENLPALNSPAVARSTALPTASAPTPAPAPLPTSNAHPAQPQPAAAPAPHADTLVNTPAPSNSATSSNTAAADTAPALPAPVAAQPEATPATAADVLPAQTVGQINAQRAKNGKGKLTQKDLATLATEADAVGITLADAAAYILASPKRTFLKAEFYKPTSAQAPAAAAEEPSIDAKRAAATLASMIPPAPQTDAEIAAAAAQAAAAKARARQIREELEAKQAAAQPAAPAAAPTAPAAPVPATTTGPSAHDLAVARQLAQRCADSNRTSGNVAALFTGTSAAPITTAPAAPTGPAAGLLPEVGPKGWAGRIVNRAMRGQHVNRGPLEEACKVVGVSFASVQASRAALTGATA